MDLGDRFHKSAENQEAMSDISHQIWDMKYRLKAPDGTPIDRDVEQTWARVALAAAQAEKPEKQIGRAHV